MNTNNRNILPLDQDWLLADKANQTLRDAYKKQIKESRKCKTESHNLFETEQLLYD